MGRKQDYFFNKNLLNIYFLLNAVSEAIVGNKTIQKMPAHIQFTIGTGPGNEQIYK